MLNITRVFARSFFFIMAVLLVTVLSTAARAQTCRTENTVQAEVVALDQPFMFNRLGSAQPQGEIFALKRDVVDSSGKSCAEVSCQPGNVMLRQDKRPRPIVLRANVGQCLQIKFTNLLSPQTTNALEPVTRHASIHVTGMELVKDINSDATFVGKNQNATVAPGDAKTYIYYAKEEGGFMLYSGAGDWAGQLSAGLFGSVTVQPANAEWYRSQVTHDDLQLAAYLVVDGKVAGNPNMTIKPLRDAAGNQITTVVDGEARPVWTLTTVEGDRQTVHTASVVIITDRLFTLDGRPLVNYQAVYPPNHPRAGTPILNLLDGNNLVHSDLTAIITGPNAGAFPLSDTSPTFNQNPASPSRRQPYREIAIHYHEVFGSVQAFEAFFEPGLAGVMGSNGSAAGSDQFAINYGASGISAEVVANRLGVGPMGRKDSVDLKFEEFFLSSWSNGDPAMVVDVPANSPNQIITNPAQGSQDTNAQFIKATTNGTSVGPAPQIPQFKPLDNRKATKAFYPDDPSNVYHSYMRDHVKFRIIHTGGGITHVHHLHAHQWLRTPNSDDSHYLDSQMINPGDAFTTEMVYNGSGNRNQTVGDAIFHCHFYPHFAGGMWSLWRIHDVFEAGTKLDRDGRPLAGVNRAYPDAEIEAGTPIPALVPMPTLAMAPAPAPVKLIDNGRRVEVLAEKNADGKEELRNPGYPFFVPGVSGHRAPHPPLDFAWEEDETGKAKLDANGQNILLDGGLPRHLVLDGKTVNEFHTRWDFSKDFIRYDKNGKAEGGLVAFQLPETGTAAEKAAMAAHAKRTHSSFQPNGDPGNFILNGLPPAHGAPFADPAVDDNGNANINTRRYKGAVIQTDVVLNKKGWHFPQQRMMTLWEDVKPVFDGKRPPQPFFFRANTGETIEFWHTNLVPDYYLLDDFQVRTPTDIIGQHIHLVKFDVTSSDGAGNGWNYEDGTFSPDEVRKRIDAVNLMGGLFNFDPATQFKGSQQTKLTAKLANPHFGTPPAGQNWTGAQTTIQRWDTDPLLNNKGVDRTMRTVFTHDHFGPSTHQQVGLYGGLLIEPEGSKWFDPITGEQFYDTTKRNDGGPTSWQANIITPNQADSYREFALEFGDFQLAYAAGSRTTAGNLPNCDPSKSGYPQSGCSAVFMSDLNSADLPKAGEAAVSPGLLSAFGRNGIVLSNQAKARSVSAGQWDVTDPSRSGENFPVKAFASLFDLCVVAANLPPSPPPPTCAAVITQLNNADLTKNIPALLNTVGIDYTTQTKIVVVKPNLSWQIVNPVTPTDLTISGTPKQQIFTVTTDKKRAALKVAGLRAFTPNLDPSWASPSFAVNPPPDTVNLNNNNGAPFPTLISVVAPPGAFSLNYRNEPIPLRVLDPATIDPKTGIGKTAAGQPGDLSFAFSSTFNRADTDLNRQPTPRHAISSGSPFQFPANLVPTVNGQQTQPCSANVPAGQVGKVQPCDPFTPLLRAYAHDKVQIRTLVGSQHNPHYFSLHGLKWLSEPSYGNSGYRNEQTMGISEHFEMLFTLPRPTAQRPFSDHLYQASSGTDGLTNGLWGLLRSYNQPVEGLTALPNNPPERLSPVAIKPPDGVQPRVFHIVATTAAQALPNGTLVYNSRGQLLTNSPLKFDRNVIEDPYAIIYVRAEDLTSPDARGKLKLGVPVEPLILRAAAGEWIQIKLTNAFDPTQTTFQSVPPPPSPSPSPAPQIAQPPFGTAGVPQVNMLTSTNVGLHAQMVSYDVAQADGTNAGFNPIQTVAPGSDSAPIYWYAGNLSLVNGRLTGTPVEFGAINLTPSDPIWQHPKGLVGALIIEPEGSSWKEDTSSRASATVTKADGTSFRDFVVLMQDDATLYQGKDNQGKPNALGGGPLALNLSSKIAASPGIKPPTAQAATLQAATAQAAGTQPLAATTPASPPPFQGGSSTVNYGTEPMPYRYPPTGANSLGKSDVFQATSNSQVGGDPQTPIYTAAAGRPVRFRMLHPASGVGNNDGNVMTIDGHVWQEEPYTDNSRRIGSNPLSQWQGTRGQHGARHRFEIVLDSAGGTGGVAGDYLYRSLIALIGGGDMQQGVWGIFRVSKEVAVTHKAEADQTGQG
ncbi:MAG: hypothetical protein ABI977_20665, partial [Acidobacteriota bacterium]